MKKTIITLLALGSIAAADVQILDLNQSVAGLYDATTGRIEGVLNSTYKISNNKPETNIALTLNLTLASKVTADTKIVELNYNDNNDVGLLATTSGLVGSWNGDPYGNSVSWNTLKANTDVFTGTDGNQYLTLMVTHWTNGGYPFGYKVNTGSSLIIETDGLGSTNITSMEDIYLNKGYLAGVNVSPEWKSSNTARQAAAAAFNTVMKGKLVPEPTTATLSLLALAGLAARRRRK